MKRFLIALAKGGASLTAYCAKTYTHYNLLRTILEMVGLPAIGGSAMAGAIDDIWQ